MGAAAALLSAGLAVGGSLIEAKGAADQAEAQTEAAKYNARVAVIQAREAANATRRQAQTIRGYNISRVAKSGVRMEGSPLSVMANNAYNAERAAQNAIRTGEAQKQLYLMQGDAARTAGQYGVASALLRGVGSMAGGANTGFAQPSTGNGFAGASSGGGSSVLYKPNFHWSAGMLKPGGQ